MVEPGQGMQADQPVTPAADALVPALDELGHVRIRGDQGWQFEAVERNRFVGCAENQPAGNRQADHQQIQGQVHQVRKAGLPGWRGRDDGRRRAAQAQGQA
ncbi:hypothetical protein D3C73_1489940 [compost metagenome]